MGLRTSDMATPEAYSALLGEYLVALSEARQHALARRAGRLKTWTRRLGSEGRAREHLASNGPLCADPKVVAVVRKYWLACDALNRRSPGSTVDPARFLVDWARTRSPALADLVAGLSYWPLGIDEAGNWT